jgi:site-specific DNA recombinase
VRTLQKELAELEQATNRPYEAAEKDLLPMDDCCAIGAKVRGKAGCRLGRDGRRTATQGKPAAMLSSKQVEAFGSALLTRLMDDSSGATKRYLGQFVGEIRFDGKRVVMRGKKAALLGLRQKKKWAPLGCPFPYMVGSAIWARTVTFTVTFSQCGRD